MSITREEFRRRLAALGYITQDQAAEALGTKQYNISRYLTGERPIPDGVVRTLELLERDPLPVLSWTMVRVLEQADGPQEPVTAPEGRVEYRTVDWKRTFEAMLQMGLLRWWEGEIVVTVKGWKALQRYIDQKERNDDLHTGSD